MNVQKSTCSNYFLQAQIIKIKVFILLTFLCDSLHMVVAKHRVSSRNVSLFQILET